MTRWVAEWRSLAPLSRAGLLILLLGALADSVAHLGGGAAPASFTPGQHAAHLVILIGMLCILLGIVLNVIWPPRRQPGRTK